MRLTTITTCFMALGALVSAAHAQRSRPDPYDPHTVAEGVGARADQLAPATDIKVVAARWGLRPALCNKTDDTADGYVVRLVCGKRVPGIEPYLAPAGAGPRVERDDEGVGVRELAIAAAAATDPAMQTLYRLGMAYRCYARNWGQGEPAQPSALKRRGIAIPGHGGPAARYLSFLYCADVAGTPPTSAEVAAATASRFPGDAYLATNADFVIHLAVDGKATTDALFAEIERAHPRMKAAFRDSADAARADFAKRHTRWADIYKALDPITEKLIADPHGKLATPCSQLEQMRVALRDELEPTDEAGISQLVARDPLGYQITEALAYCYLGQAQIAKAKRELDHLTNTLRPVTLEEVEQVARWQAYLGIEKELANARGPTILDELPAASELQYGPWAPPSREVGRLSTACKTRCPQRESGFDHDLHASELETRGLDPDKPAIVESLQPGAGGVVATFKNLVELVPYHDQRCADTNLPDYIQITSVGESHVEGHIIYKTICQDVGPEKHRKIDHREDPITIPADQAALLGPGMQVTILVHGKDGDAAILDAWMPVKGKTPVHKLIIGGLKLQAARGSSAGGGI